MGACFFIVHNHCIDFSVLERYNSDRPSLLLDDEGNEWARFWSDRREPVDISRIPRHLINAFIAAEDREFFSHHGISWRGIIRSLLVNMYRGRKVQGASTITQQLVKLLFFDAQKTYTRKIKEQIYALLVELQFTKNQILQTYLNNVYFGYGIYGVEAAAQRFWSKHVWEVTVDESALLAGIICSPARYCPLMHPLSAQKRRNSVLAKMRNVGLLSDEYYAVACTQPVTINKQPETIAPHAKEFLQKTLENIVGKTALYCSGLRIQTTINKQMQLTASRIFTQEMMKLRKEFGEDLDGGLIVLERKTGAIKALVGGIDFASSQFNRAIQARRQMGSCFKPLIYAAALENGLHFTDTVIDEPIELLQHGTPWRPKNYNERFNGCITLAYALSHSNNIASIKTLLKIGTKPVIMLAQKVHIKGPFHHYPSLALGCIDATLFEVAGMFNVFAHDGIYSEPHALSWVKDRWGTKIYKEPAIQEQVVSTLIVGSVASVLRLSSERLKRIQGADQWPDCDVISKTGTTNDSRTCWYVGSTPTLTTAIYVGFDDNRPMGKNVFPLKTALPIWRSFNRAITCTEKHFSYDPLLKDSVIDEKTGQLSEEGRSEAIKIKVWYTT